MFFYKKLANEVKKLTEIMEEKLSVFASINEKLTTLIEKQDTRITRTEDNIITLCGMQGVTIGSYGFEDNTMTMNLTGETIEFSINYRTNKIVHMQDAIPVYIMGVDGNQKKKYTSEKELTEDEKEMFKKYECVYIMEK